MPSATFKPRTDDRQSQAGPLPAAGGSNWRRWIVRPSIILAALLSAYFLIQSCVPLRTAVQIGADEGFELTKATLCLKGYKLYTEVWNDQPPLHTYLIAQILRHLSPSILGPRMVTVLFAAVLLASVFFIVLLVSTTSNAGAWATRAERQAGRAALLPKGSSGVSPDPDRRDARPTLVAALTTALLIASPGFIELSSSCMLEIPALAPAIAALSLLLVRKQNKWHISEILSGILFGIALQMKLVTVILLPLTALIVWLKQCKTASPLTPPSPLVRREERVVDVSRRSMAKAEDGVKGSSRISQFFPKNLIRSALFLVASLAISFVAIDYLVDGGAYLHHFQQSWSSHFAPARSFEYGSPNEHPFDWSILLKNWDTTVPAILGILVCLNQIRKTPVAILSLAWLALMLVIFATHKPWWPYYYIHIAIPLCWCAAIGWEAICHGTRHRRSVASYVFLGLFGICAAGWMAARVYLQVTGIRNSPQTYSSLVLGQIERLKPFTKFIYADESIYSFHTSIPMPPDLAVVPLKRLWSGDLTNARIAEKMGAIKPEVILLRNDTREVPFQDLIDSEYRVVYQDAQHRLYTQKALAKQAGY